MGKDSRTDERLSSLHDWTQKAGNRGLALSNPKFEYWLVLHFEDLKGNVSSRDCTDGLRRHLPDYDKGIDIRKFTPQRIDDAVLRARQRGNPPCVDWPHRPGSTTVYKLVERILRS